MDCDGKIPLVTKAGRYLSKKEVHTQFNYLLNPKEVGVWTWLNAKFPEGSGFNGMDIETHSYKKEGNKTIITIERSPLEKCLEENCFADLDALNEQGLPMKKSRRQIYQPGKNVYFWSPEINNVAGFGAVSVWVDLIYYVVPQDSYAGLGVLGCAEGAPKS